ncbi:class I SAM-dependent methyltransferase [Mycobacterium sp. 1274756.6]|uniref:class I SAM-dependent methyltransferase n=1 Tax=Mycobacterium sp. 1274756.6 TaxID=1834076 RepID=UPI000B252315|nr:class I SAM-dependent methyltransferase [Mycobacterium sp. 1274756.6]
MTAGAHRGDYGVDGSFHVLSAPVQAGLLAAGCAALTGYAARSAARGRYRRAGTAAAITAALLAQAGLYAHATRRGKFAVWAELLDGLRLRGDETVLDLGCGRGAVLCAVAKRLPRGRAIGVDVWQADQTGNAEQTTWANATLEGVADRVELHTADITTLPFDDASVDVVVSNLVIHNIPGRAGRRRALLEAVRVLRPGGRLIIADLWETDRHAAGLAELGWANVQRRNLGWRMWYGGPWSPTHVVTATKPA